MRKAMKVIGRSIGSARGRVLYLIGLAALIFVPLELLGAATDGFQVDTDEFDDGEPLTALAGGVTFLVSNLIGEILYTGAVAVALVRLPPGAAPSLHEIVRNARWGTLVAIDLLFVTGTVLGLLLLVIPGLIFLARFFLVAVVAEIEELGVRASFRRSFELSRGSALLVFGLMFTAFLLGDLAGELLEVALDEIAGDGFVAAWLSGALGSVLLNPVVAVLAVNLALELGAGIAGRPERPGRA